MCTYCAREIRKERVKEVHALMIVAGRRSTGLRCVTEKVDFAAICLALIVVCVGIRSEEHIKRDALSNRNRFVGNA